RHLLALAENEQRPESTPPTLDAARQARWRERLSAGPMAGGESMALLADYGLAVPAHATVTSAREAVAAAEDIGWPVVLKTDDPGIAHKSDVGGVLLGLDSADAVAWAYEDVSSRLGPRALVMATAPVGTELSLGIVRDRLLGPVVVVGAGGVLVEILADRAVGIPPLDAAGAHRLLDRLTARAVLEGVRGAPPADVDAVAAAVIALSVMAVELGEVIEALDVNPLRCGPFGALALDALVVPR
ncbi:MAG: acetate--CoA ligase family protein, partial [Acidimicrobiales bacterium]